MATAARWKTHTQLRLELKSRSCLCCAGATPQDGTETLIRPNAIRQDTLGFWGRIGLFFIWLSGCRRARTLGLKFCLGPPPKNCFESTQLPAAAPLTACLRWGCDLVFVLFKRWGTSHSRRSVFYIWLGLIALNTGSTRATQRRTERCKTSKPGNIYPCNLRLEMPPRINFWRGAVWNKKNLRPAMSEFRIPCPASFLLVAINSTFPRFFTPLRLRRNNERDSRLTQNTDRLLHNSLTRWIPRSFAIFKKKETIK